MNEFSQDYRAEKKILATIRATARKRGKNKLSARETDHEIQSYRLRLRREESQISPALKKP